MKFSHLFLLFIFLSSNNEAQQANTKLPKFKCKKGHTINTQIEINLCSREEFEFYDSILNNRYKTLFKMINSSENYNAETASKYKLAIKKSQRLWVQLRDKNSTTISLPIDGSMKDLVINNQLSTDTKNRILFLDKLINNF